MTQASRAEQQLILLSAGTAERRRAMAGRADTLLGDVDWQNLADTLRARRLLATLGPRVVDLADGRASEDFSAAVHHAIATGRRHSAFLQLVALRAIAMLEAAGIPAVALKGPLLGEAIYGDPGRRSSSDVDLLVRPEQLSLAVDVIRELGYQAPTDHVDHSGLPSLHYVLVHERGELPPVELHWRVHWYEGSFARDRLLPPIVDAQGGWRPDAADELAALLLFYARDGFIDLRLASDLGAWWDVNQTELPASALDSLLLAYPALARVIPAALKVAERVIGLPAQRLIGDTPTLGMRGRLAVRLAHPNPHGSRSQLYADAGVIDGLLMPPGGFRSFVRRQVVLPRAVFDEYARRAPEWRAKSPVDYGLRTLARYGLSLLRAVRTPEALR